MTGQPGPWDCYCVLDEPVGMADWTLAEDKWTCEHCGLELRDRSKVERKSILKGSELAAMEQAKIAHTWTKIQKERELDMLREWMFVNGIDYDSFKGKLLVLYGIADLSNQKKLASVFPMVGIAHAKFMKGEPFKMD